MDPMFCGIFVCGPLQLKCRYNTGRPVKELTIELKIKRCAKLITVLKARKKTEKFEMEITALNYQRNC